MTAGTAFLAMLRVERRELLRNRRRSRLIAFLVAIPVAATVGGATVWRNVEPNVDERRTREMGAADLRVDLGAAETPDDLTTSLPPGARIETLRLRPETLHHAGRRLRARAIAADPDGLARGMLRIVEGRAPARPGEMALAPVLRDGLGAALGTSIATEDGERTVTGVVVDPASLEMPVALLPPEADGPFRDRALLIDVGGADAAGRTASALRERGLRVLERSSIRPPDRFGPTVVFLVGGIGLFEAALVVAAAFAVGLRRRRREIGLLRATGASGALVCGAVGLSAAALAAVAGAAGASLGLLAAAAIHPFLDAWVGHECGRFEVAPEHVAGGVLLGIVAAALASLPPAVAATRRSIRSALGGRRPEAPKRSRGPLLGLATAGLGAVGVAIGERAGGAAGATALLLGAATVILGFGVASSGLLAAIARLAAPLPPAWRLAVRDAARFRTRSGPVVTAVLAAMALCVLLGALLTSVEARLAVARPPLRADRLVVAGPAAEEVARAFAREHDAPAPIAAHAAHVDGAPAVVPGGGGFGAWLAFGDDVSRLRLGAAAETSDVEIETADGRPLGTFSVHLVPRQAHADPAAVIDPGSAGARGLERGPPPGFALAPWIVTLDDDVTEETAERARAAAAAHAGTSVDAAVLHRRPVRPFLRLALVVCLLTGLIVVFMATALSSSEAAEDARILDAVGAPPALLRRASAARAATLAAVGGVLAVPAGLLPASGVLTIARLPLTFEVPWTEIAASAVLLPALAYAGAWIAARPEAPA
ncbi:MAG: FtsX-like permease family protein [Planctomycetota bacterium JB042]